MVPLRPEISLLPSTENMIAGSVGASAAPSTPAVVQEKPSTKCETSASSPAVMNVPSRPSDTIGIADSRKRLQPTRSPPSKRITASEIEATRSTLRVERCETSGKMSETAAAASRKSAPGGTRTRSARRVDTIAASAAAEMSATRPPKCVSSLTP